MLTSSRMIRLWALFHGCSASRYHLSPEHFVTDKNAGLNAVEICFNQLRQLHAAFRSRKSALRQIPQPRPSALPCWHSSTTNACYLKLLPDILPDQVKGAWNAAWLRHQSSHCGLRAVHSLAGRRHHVMYELDIGQQIPQRRLCAFGWLPTWLGTAFPFRCMKAGTLQHAIHPAHSLDVTEHHTYANYKPWVIIRLSLSGAFQLLLRRKMSSVLSKKKCPSVSQSSAH